MKREEQVAHVLMEAVLIEKRDAYGYLICPFCANKMRGVLPPSSRWANKITCTECSRIFQIIEPDGGVKQ